MTVSVELLAVIPFGKPGCVDDVTGRMGLTIEMWQKIGDPDLPVYWCTGEAFGGDEWVYVDGIDLHVDGFNADVWFEGGQCKTVPIGTVIYMARKHAEPLLPETLAAALGLRTDEETGSLAVLRESESLLRAVDSSPGSFLDKKADALRKASDDMAEMIEAVKVQRAINEPGPWTDPAVRMTFAKLVGLDTYATRAAVEAKAEANVVAALVRVGGAE